MEVMSDDDSLELAGLFSIIFLSFEFTRFISPFFRPNFQQSLGVYMLNSAVAVLCMSEMA
jgi:hypothetical protein